MSQRHPFEAKLAETWPPATWWELNVLVAVSGGPDSMALLRSICALKSCGEGRIFVAHFNHRLRGEAADGDEAFVAAVARQLRLPLEVGRPPNTPPQRFGKHGLEGWARQARYRFLTETAAKVGARLVAVAHTADDQAETILHRILRGTGIRGLAGMRRARPLSEAVTLVRPLLPFRRSEIRDYLRDLGQDYRVDASNFDVRRTRNRIRCRLLPELVDQFNPNLVEALLRLGSLAAEVQSAIEPMVELQLERCLVKSDPQMVCLDFGRIPRQSPYVVRAMFMAVWQRQGWPLRQMGFANWDLLAALAEPSVQRRAQAFPGGVTAETSAGIVRLQRRV
jgi:tRNA(Ile)-lysidine synthase